MSIGNLSSEGKNKSDKRCVCISCFNYYETRISYIRNYFENKGIETIYITSNYNHFEKRFFYVDYPNTIQLAVPAYKKNISISRIISQLIFSVKTYRSLKKLSPDIIYCMFPPNSLVALVIRYKKNRLCKVAFDCFDMWPESLPIHGILKQILSPFLIIWKNLRDNNIEKGNLVLAVSQDMCDSVRKMWPRVPANLLLPGVSVSNLPTYTYDISNQLSFCYLGNINNITDIDLLVKLLSAVNKHKKVLLHIIGKGLKLDDLVNNLKSKDIECRLHGVVMDTSKKREIYSQCNLGLNLPKEEILSGMSLKSVEYMAVGLPFINSGIADNWKIVEDYKVGINVNKRDVQKCVDTILSLSNEDIQTMSNSCLKYSKNRFETQNLDNILKEVL